VYLRFTHVGIPTKVILSCMFDRAVSQEHMPFYRTCQLVVDDEGTALVNYKFLANNAAKKLNVKEKRIVYLLN